MQHLPGKHDRGELALLPCGHRFHRDCVTAVLKATASVCPECRAPADLKRDVLSPALEFDQKQQTARFGTKIAKVVETARAIRAAEPLAKCVVFVQWDTLLRKVHAALAESGLPCLGLKGNIFQRQQVLRRFEESAAEEHAFLLLSLESSTSGMNLTCANHLLLVHPCLVGDSQTAVAYEQQAIGRLVRQGQGKTVNVHRFVTQGTLEQRLTEAHQKSLYEAFLERDQARRGAQGAGEAAAAPPPGP